VIGLICKESRAVSLRQKYAKTQCVTTMVLQYRQLVRRVQCVRHSDPRHTAAEGGRAEVARTITALRR